MCYLINNANNVHLNIYDKVERPEQKFTGVNTIEYDIKQYQVKNNIVNYTYVQLKILKIPTTHRREFGRANNI